MKKLLRLLTAAGIFQVLLITLAAVYWLAQPSLEDQGLSLPAIWNGFFVRPTADGAILLGAAVNLPEDTDEPSPHGVSEKIQTSVAATLAHLPAEQFTFASSTATQAPTEPMEVSPTPSPTDQTSLSASPSPSATITLTFSPTQTHTSLPSATQTAWPSSTPSATVSRTPRPTFTPTRTASATLAGTPSITPTASRTPTPSNTSLPATSTPTVSGPAPTPTVDLSGCSYNNDSSFEEQVLALLNQEREAVGLAPLIMQSQLRAAARDHSADMACNNFVSHTGSNGTTSYIRITSHGYYPTWWGENIYKGWRTTPEDAVTWWMNSEPHRNNILHSYYIHIGVGYVRVGDSGAYTLNFGRR